MKGSRIIGSGVLAVGLMLGGIGGVSYQGKAQNIYFMKGQTPPVVESAGYTGGYGTCTDGKCVDQWRFNKKGRKFAQKVEQEPGAAGSCPLQAPSCAKCG